MNTAFNYSNDDMDQDFIIKMRSRPSWQMPYLEVLYGPKVKKIMEKTSSESLKGEQYLGFHSKRENVRKIIGKSNVLQSPLPLISDDEPSPFSLLSFLPEDTIESQSILSISSDFNEDDNNSLIELKSLPTHPALNISTNKEKKIPVEPQNKENSAVHFLEWDDIPQKRTLLRQTFQQDKPLAKKPETIVTSEVLSLKEDITETREFTEISHSNPLLETTDNTFDLFESFLQLPVSPTAQQYREPIEEEEYREPPSAVEYRATPEEEMEYREPLEEEMEDRESAEEEMEDRATPEEEMEYRETPSAVEYRATPEEEVEYRETPSAVEYRATPEEEMEYREPIEEEEYRETPSAVEYRATPEEEVEYRETPSAVEYREPLEEEMESPEEAEFEPGLRILSPMEIEDSADYEQVPVKPAVTESDSERSVYQERVSPITGDKVLPERSLSPLVKGTLVRHQYQIRKLMVHNSYYNVYLISPLDIKDRKNFYLHEIIPYALSFDEKEIERRLNLYRENIKILATVSHPNLAEVYEFFSEEGREYFLMEAVEGLNLRKLAEMNRTHFTEEEIVRWGLALADGIFSLQNRDNPFYLGNLGLENIRVDFDGNIKLVDYDMQRFFSGEEIIDGKQIPAGKQYGDIVKLSRIIYFMINKEEYTDEGTLIIPDYISVVLKDLLKKTCGKEQKEIGYMGDLRDALRDISCFHEASRMQYRVEKTKKRTTGLFKRLIRTITKRK